MRRILIVSVLCAIILPQVIFAKTPDDPLLNEQWYLGAISAEDAWDTETGSREVIVAVLDAGVDLNHPDLDMNIWTNPGEIAGNGIDDDKNGFVDDIHGWDFVDNDHDPVPYVGSGSTNDAIAHGSLVAGLIGAEGNNGEGVTGVAWKVSIMSIRILDATGGGSSYNATRAINYAVQNGADVINLSFSGDESTNDLRDAVRDAYQAGVVVVAALGNNARNTDIEPIYPACYKSGLEDWIIGVASSGLTDDHSTFSNYGKNCTDISAPGEQIDGLTYNDSSNGFTDLYAYGWNGTSMSAPLVSGAAVLLIAHYPDLSATDVRNILKLSVDPMPVLGVYRGKVGAGRLNVARALQYGANYGITEVVEDVSNNGVDTSQQEEEYGVSPITGALELISNVVARSYISSPGFQSVYFIANDFSRYAFVNEDAYFTWQDSFDSVSSVTDATLGTLPLGGLMLPKPGVVLVKIQSNPVVYAVEENPVNELSPILREITSEQIAITMYGENWADYVIDISPSFWTRYTLGSPIEIAEVVDISIMKTRQQLANLASK
ncbi:MAG: S8 family peptidase [Candidatus Uhrbacteria bacterium]|nr:S8 family peptidase [Candidatus Uhrbacteria bacterium]